MQHKRSIVILDFGGQYAHLIGSRVRRCGAYAAIMEPETPAQELKDAAGIILSGGPQSVYDAGSPQADPAIFELGIPVLGLCYGHQWMTQALGGSVQEGKVKEYGKTQIDISDGGQLLQSGHPTVWMSHGDSVAQVPDGFSITASSSDCPVAAMENSGKQIFGFQFHPEVTHTDGGTDMLSRFVDLCNPAEWSMASYAKQVGAEILEEVGDRKVFMLVSGGVDSSVAFVLLNQVLGTDRVQGLLVDTGLMRKDEVKLIKDAFDELGIHNLRVEDAADEFFTNLADVYAPEKKRAIIGDTFLAVQKRVSEEMHLRMEDGWMMGQGTIYPDTIETGATKHAAKIKTHHNRVEAVQKMIDAGLVIEPLKDLYKDEVRQLGEEIGLPHDLVWRHPFPGPGLGVRILCHSGQGENVTLSPVEGSFSDIDASFSILPVKSVGVQGDGRTYRHALALFSDTPCHVSDYEWSLATSIPNQSPDVSRVLKCVSHTDQQNFLVAVCDCNRVRADLLREADAIADQVTRAADLYAEIWQFPVVLLPFGIHGGQSVVLRPINSTDAMTADAFALSQEVLESMTKQIMNLEGIDCVFLDLTNKPPGTIEWE